MSRIVFINPSVDKYADVRLWSSELINYLNGKPMNVLPKMVPMVMAALTPPQHSFTFIDEEIEELDYDKIDADFVAITAMTVQADRAYEIAGEFRRRGKKVAMGGIHATVLPEEVELHADAVCVGEGENIWPLMLADFEAGSLKQRYEAKDYPPVTRLVSPRADVIKHDHYSMFSILSSKGCPNDCEFCSIKFSTGHKIRLKPVEQVVDEIRELEKYNRGFLKKPYWFVDDNLYIDRAYTKKLFKALAGLHITWYGQATLETAKDGEVLQLMAESGCRNLVFGFESIAEESLKEANKQKSNRVGEYKAVTDNMTRHGLISGGDFIFGFDSDAKNVFRDTRDFVIKSDIFPAYFNVLTPYPGTRLYERVKHRIFDRRWPRYGAVWCVFTPKNMTPDELIAGARWAAGEITQMNTFKQLFTNFWSHGPWVTNPPLNLTERIFLLVVGLKLRKVKKYKEYANFMFWAASRRKAVNIFMIIQAVHYADMVKNYFTGGYDPA